MCSKNYTPAGEDLLAVRVGPWLQKSAMSSACDRFTSIPVCLAMLAVLLPYSSVHVSWFVLYPLLALNGVLLAAIAISYVSLEASIDVVAFVFQLVWSPISVLFSLKVNLLELKDEHFNNVKEKAQSVPRWLKQGLFFLLIQQMFVVNTSITGLEWFCTLLSYRLLANVTRECVSEADNSFVAHNKPVSCHSIETTADDDSDTSNFSKKAERFLAAAAMATTIYYNEPAMTALSLSYFLLSEDILNSFTKSIIESLQIDFMEGLEICYMEGLLLLIESVLSFVVISYLSFVNFHWSVIPALYICLYQPVQNFKNNVLLKIKCESLCLSAFRQASQTELKSLNDVCAICLGAMNSGRVTECNHIFHGKCLKECLRKKPSCPMCNQRLLL